MHYRGVAPPFDLSAKDQPKNIKHAIGRLTLEGSGDVPICERRVGNPELEAIPTSHRSLHFVDCRFSQDEATAEPCDIVVHDSSPSRHDLSTGFQQAIVSRLKNYTLPGRSVHRAQGHRAFQHTYRDSR